VALAPGRDRLAAAAVHAYTASGVVLALLIVEAAYAGNAVRALWLLLAALIIDGTDGMLARRFRVKERLPGFDGALLDNIVDYLTYAFAPVLLLLSLSRVLLRPATRRLMRIERALGPLASPITGIVLWLFLMYLWHVPALYEAAITNPVVHLIEHASFFTAGLAVWWPLIQPVPMRRGLTGLWTVAYIGCAKFGLAALGLYLTWSGTVAYDYYAQLPRIWGLDPVEDQNAGGAIMMVEQSLTFVIALVVLFAALLRQSEIEERRRERLEDAGAANP